MTEVDMPLLAEASKRRAIFVEAFEREFRTAHSSINRNDHGDEKESEEEERGTLQRRKRARTGGRGQQQLLRLRRSRRRGRRHLLR